MTVRYRVTVSQTGEISVTTEGVRGPGCLDEIDTIQRLCSGAQLVNSQLTDDYLAHPLDHVEMIEETQRGDT